MAKQTQEGSVQIADFKSRLSHYLKAVRQGKPLVLLNRDTPVARVLPYLAEPGRLIVRKPSRPSSEVRLPPPVRQKVNSLRALLEERRERK